MKAKKQNIANLFEEKAPAPAPQETSAGKGRQTLFRLQDPARRQLDYLGIDLGKTLQDMLIEATNDYFIKHGKPPIA